jgi:hypothetical protein
VLKPVDIEDIACSHLTKLRKLAQPTKEAMNDFVALVGNGSRFIFLSNHYLFSLPMACHFHCVSAHVVDHGGVENHVGEYRDDFVAGLAKYTFGQVGHTFHEDYPLSTRDLVPYKPF